MDIEKIKIPGANSFELISIKAIETYAPQFIGYNKLFLGSLKNYASQFLDKHCKFRL